MGSLLGLTGQGTYNYMDHQRMKRLQAAPQNSESSFKQFLQSSWSPVKMLSKEDYAKILNDKLLAVEAEIALVEEEIELLKKRGPESKGSNGASNPR